MEEEMSKQNCRGNIDKEKELEIDWEKKYITTRVRNEMESMWEIPQIFHFLQLTKKALNISHLSMYEVERMLLMPKASKQLANIMTCLLSSPNLKSKLHKLPPMPYEFWTNVLMHKVRTWFKIYQNKHKNIIKVFESVGIESQFWNLFPDISCLEGKDFETFAFKQKVWLLKTLCDTILHSRKTIQEEVLKHSWEDRIETILGIDRHGARYIYFPHFLENDLRVYRHCLDNGIMSTVKAPIIKEEPNWDVKDEDTVKFSNLKTGRSKRRKSRWRNGSLPYKGKRKKDREKKRRIERLNNLSYNSDIFKSLVKNESLSDQSSPEKKKQLNIVSFENIPNAFKGFQSNSEEELDNMTIIYNILDQLITTIEENTTNSEESLLDQSLTENQQQDEEEEEEEQQPQQSTTDNEINDGDDVTNYLESNFAETTSDVDETNNKISDTEEKGEEKLNEDLKNDEVGLDKWLNALSKKKDSHDDDDDDDEEEIEHNSKLELKEKNENKNQELKEHSSKDNDYDSNAESDNEVSLIELRDILLNEASFDESSHVMINTSKQHNFQNIKFTETESWNIAAKDFNELITDLSESKFKLIADSVETLRNLIRGFSCKDNLTEINKNISDFTPVCEVNLLNKLTELLKSVECLETALKDCTMKAKSKLQKEWTNHKDGNAEDKESSSEDGQSSNWWVIGSQNCMLSPCGSLTEHSDCEFGKRADNQKCKFNDDEENKGKENEESDEDDNEEEETKRRPTRVLRARGIPSYTEQFLSDNSETEELERWTEFEATYTSPNAPINSSTLLPYSQVDKPDKRTDPEDSDQEWILPSSRKKRRKRQSASRRLKSFQNKLQNIQSTSMSPTNATSSEMTDEKPNIPLMNESNENVEKAKESTELPESSSNSAKDPKIPMKESLIKVVPPSRMKIECADSVHSELDIKDEGPIIDNPTNYNNMNTQQTPGYVIVKTEPPSPGYHYPTQQNPPMPGVVQQQYMQQNPYVPNHLPQTSNVHSSHPYYVQNPPNYVLHNQHPYGQPMPPRHPMGLQQQQMQHQQQQQQHLQQQMLLQQQQQRPQVISGHQVITHPNYVQYNYMNNQPNMMNHPRARLPNLNNQRPYLNRAQLMNQSVRMGLQNRMNIPRQNYNHPNGAVIRSMPLAGNGMRNPVPRARHPGPRMTARVAAPPQRLRLPKPNPPAAAAAAAKKNNTTSLIVLSDSDDEIEMIYTEKKRDSTTPSVSPRKTVQTSPRRKPIVTSEVTVAKSKSTLPPQIMQRMSQGGISITPVKANPPPVTNPNTQLVVVVNETGSHYALALPNGSKLILTPEQVAQIRASNGGKLIL
ncbi:probable serine/threonine-protein kinase DDB_G0282963 isoform X1 [Leptopilina heterotoma]|uniref:probable serine/threonine-protein kinase DDB_G0282963 isoform X1 n=1 Tax=Leptopilina heterotoma TaxID=63436 RepID=UPI001CA87D09|nr:probable serine/threonine-protein kinase DDB_G0282963 isoform X1 [Leptopilina heterotoma]XP_043471333.1 probable serine/threonine-protein kinase DDB_G0282963 isoform X1 [Leptopilina heterotoma]